MCSLIVGSGPNHLEVLILLALLLAKNIRFSNPARSKKIAHNQHRTKGETKILFSLSVLDRCRTDFLDHSSTPFASCPIRIVVPTPTSTLADFGTLIVSKNGLRGIRFGEVRLNRRGASENPL